MALSVCAACAPPLPPRPADAVPRARAAPQGALPRRSRPLVLRHRAPAAGSLAAAAAAGRRRAAGPAQPAVGALVRAAQGAPPQTQTMPSTGRPAQPCGQPCLLTLISLRRAQPQIHTAFTIEADSSDDEAGGPNTNAHSRQRSSKNSQGSFKLGTAQQPPPQSRVPPPLPAVRTGGAGFDAADPGQQNRPPSPRCGEPCAL